MTLHYGPASLRDAQTFFGRTQRALRPVLERCAAETATVCRTTYYSAGQALPDGAIGRLPEVAALGVLEVSAARNEGDLHIGQGCPDEHAQMLLFLKMRQHQPLPVLD